MASSKTRCCVLFALILSVEVDLVVAASVEAEEGAALIKVGARLPHTPEIKEAGDEWEPITDLGKDSEVFLLASFAFHSLKERSGPCIGGDASACKMVDDILKDSSLHEVKSAETLSCVRYNPKSADKICGLHVQTRIECSTSSIVQPTSVHGTIQLDIFRQYLDGVNLDSLTIDEAQTPELNPLEDGIKGQTTHTIYLDHAAFERFEEDVTAKAEDAFRKAEEKNAEKVGVATSSLKGGDRSEMAEEKSRLNAPWIVGLILLMIAAVVGLFVYWRRATAINFWMRMAADRDRWKQMEAPYVECCAGA